MATNFQIKKGLSINLFDENGDLRIIPEEGCWYITTDTFELYACFDGIFKAIGSIPDFETRLSALETRIEKIVQTYGYKSGLPKVGEENVIYVVAEENAEYRWDNASQTYYCIARDYQEITSINGGNAEV